MPARRKILLTVSRDLNTINKRTRIITDFIVTRADGQIPMAERNRIERVISGLARDTKEEWEVWDFEHDSSLPIEVGLALEIPGAFGQYNWFSALTVVYSHGRLLPSDREYLWQTITRIVSGDIRFERVPNEMGGGYT